MSPDRFAVVIVPLTPDRTLPTELFGFPTQQLLAASFGPDLDAETYRWHLTMALMSLLDHVQTMNQSTFDKQFPADHFPMVKR